MQSLGTNGSVAKNDLRWAGWLGAIALLLYVSTAQLHINGSQSPYATDIGEIQNALPRWGTLHFTGYPLYTLLGSLFVTLLRPIGIAPAAGSSLFSALWGAVSIALLYLLARELGAPSRPALAASLVAAVSTSMWIDASIAEIHTMTMALTLASLLFAVRFARDGHRRDLLLLALVFTQGVAHQRAVAFAAIGLAWLILPRWREVIHELPLLIVIALLAPLTYLYLPLRAWQGAEWTFNQPGTWNGLWTMISDTKSGRILSPPGSAAEWLARIRILIGLLRDDLPLTLVGLGSLGLIAHAIGERSRSAWATLAIALPYFLLCLIIWEGQVSDALLAVKLPFVLLAALGLSLLPVRWLLPRWGEIALAVLLLGGAVNSYSHHRPIVLDITRDRSTEVAIAEAEAIPRSGEQPTTLMALWGHDYWALTYAQTFRGELQGLNIVDHNARFGDLLDQGQRLVTLQKTFYRWPLERWQSELGPVQLSSAAFDMVEISRKGKLLEQPLAEGAFALGNGIAVEPTMLAWSEPQQIRLSLDWVMTAETDYDYSVAVHLLSRNPPEGPQHILAQADRNNPVYGWYPTSQWLSGERVHDDYVINVPPDTIPVGVRIGMYRQATDGQFLNTEWLFLPIDPPYNR